MSWALSCKVHRYRLDGTYKKVHETPTPKNRDFNGKLFSEQFLKLFATIHFISLAVVSFVDEVSKL